MTKIQSRLRTALVCATALSAIFTASAALAAQTYGETVLHSFGASAADGQDPYQNPLLLGPDGNFYGMTSAGGDNGNGTLFRMAPDGTLTTLHSFGPVDASSGAGPDAAQPSGNGLMLASDGNFYGTVRYGGNNTYGLGAIIKLTPDGQESVLHALQGDGSQEGYEPVGRLVQGADGALYGVTEYGGANMEGVIFRVTLDGQYSVLHTFCGQLPDGSYDVCRPNAGMILASDGNFYGTLLYDSGSDPVFNNGGIFQLKPDGSYTVIHKFLYNANDGEYPEGALLQGPDGALYGTTTNTVFRITLDGLLTTLYMQQPLQGHVGATSPDGSEIDSTLVRGADGTLYGTAPGGGAYGKGLLFKVATDGSFGVLDYFTGANGNVAAPSAGVIFGGDGNLYGTSIAGGSAGQGSVYRMSLPPPTNWGTGSAPVVTVSLSTTTIHLTQKPYAMLSWSAPDADSCSVSSTDGKQFPNGPKFVANQGKMVVHPTMVRNSPFYYNVSCSHNGLEGMAESAPLTVTLK